MKLKNLFLPLIAITLLSACRSQEEKVPVVGFVDAFEDATISRARDGFNDALKNGGFSEDEKTVKIIYRNAQGDIPTLTQIANYFISQKTDLIATSTTLSTISVVQKTKTIPIFMMVAPTPELMKLVDKNGKAPSNLFGVEEELAYIDTSFSIIPKLVKTKGSRLTVGMIYNQSEPQSVDAFNRIKMLAAKLNVTLRALPLNTSADAQMITKSLLSNQIDAFFANPDNTVFASFETILRSCNEQTIPIFTSEAGLVERGAVAAFGADIYQWGFQAGEQAVQYLKSNTTVGLKPEMVKVRKRVYNADAAKRFNISIPANFEAVK